MRFVFWQPTNSPHQFAHLDALSQNAGEHTVELVVTQSLTAERLRMKWIEPAYERVTVYKQPNLSQIDIITRTRIQDSIHIFSGIAADAIAAEGLKRCIVLGVRVGIMAEASDWYGHDFRRFGRLAKHLMLRLKYGRHISLILAIGELGVSWYKRLGYSEDIIKRYGYFIDKSQIETPQPPIPEILYVGRAVKYKGGDLLLKSLANIEHLNWKATFVTEGPCAESWQQLAHELNLDARVSFVPFEASDLVYRRMAAASMLVLPNVGDEGWGAVVNEALLQGTPVICTDRTGAKDLISDNRGFIARPTVAELSNALIKQLEIGIPSAELRHELIAWIKGHYSGSSGAKILVEAVK